MRGRAIVLAAAFGLAGPVAAQSDEAPEAQRTAEQFIETARNAYALDKPEPAPCPEATSDEIVVCRQYEDMPDQRLQSPTQRAYAAGEMPPDPIPNAPDLYGGMRGGVIVARGCFVPPCPRPMPPLVDFDSIPEPLTPEEAALVYRAEDAPSPEAASPAAAP
jgi:hypothetical protein